MGLAFARRAGAQEERQLRARLDEELIEAVADLSNAHVVAAGGGNALRERGAKSETSSSVNYPPAPPATEE